MLIGWKVERRLEPNSTVFDQKFQKLNNQKVGMSSGFTEVKTQLFIRNMVYKVQDQNWKRNKAEAEKQNVAERKEIRLWRWRRTRRWTKRSRRGADKWNRKKRVLKKQHNLKLKAAQLKATPSLGSIRSFQAPAGAWFNIGSRHYTDSQVVTKSQRWTKSQADDSKHIGLMLSLSLPQFVACCFLLALCQMGVRKKDSWLVKGCHFCGKVSEGD